MAETQLVDWTGRPVAASRPRGKRYQAAEPSNLLADWWTPLHITADQAILPFLARLRGRCRSLERENPYVRRFLTLLKIYVFGWKGINLEVKSRYRRRHDRVNLKLNHEVREEWEEFGELGNFDVTGKFSARSGDVFALLRTVIDGEHFIRLVRGYPNKWNFAVQFIEADAIDHEFQTRLENGNLVKAGIEFDSWGRPLTYFVTDEHNERVPIPAADMIHCGVFERTPQSRCVPWICSAILNLRQFGEYEHAEIVTARVCSAKMGVIERTPESVAYSGATEDEQGNLVSEVAPGVIELLDPGQSFKPYDPGQPKSEFATFRKAFLRGIACSFNVGYNALASDLEGVNYSSLRHGQKDDVEVYREISHWWISLVKWRVFEAWLEMATLSGAVDAPGYTFDDIPLVIDSTYFKPRGYDYIDPVKDRTADLLGIANKLDTRTAVLARRGDDLEETLETLAHEEELGEAYDLDMGIVGIGGGGGAKPAAGGGGGSSGTGEPPPNPVEKSKNGNGARGELIFSSPWLNPARGHYRKVYRSNTVR